jgi:SAM-dependent methyltransferase
MSFEASAKVTLIDLLACPSDHTFLELNGDHLICAQGHRFAMEQGMPIFAANPRRELTPGNMAPCQPADDREAAVDPFVNDWIVNTNGNLYWQARGKLKRYPIPQWPYAAGRGEIVVDIGCSWGRWSAAAARAGYRPIGVDVHVDALAAAGRVTRKLGLEADFVCADADRLPFRSKSVDIIFSYSVLQHLERAVVKRFFADAARVLKPGGTCLIQLPNRFGLLSLLQQMRRGFREAKAGTFEMRYWSAGEISEGLREAELRAIEIRTDGFFSQNPRASDRDLLSAKGRLIVTLSEAGRRASEILPLLTYFADSFWVEAKSVS